MSSYIWLHPGRLLRPDLSVVSGADVVRTLARRGFGDARRRDSHVVLRRGPSRCVVPDHRELKLGMLAGILGQVGISQDDFPDASNR